MPGGTDMLVSYWPLAALAAVLVLVLLLPVRSLMRRTIAATPAPAPAAPPAPPPTAVQRLAASLEQAARDRAQTANAPAAVVAVPPSPRASAWTAREAVPQAPELEPQLPVLPPALLEPANDAGMLRGHQAFGRPPGLRAPRPEGRDDLKLIHGIGPRIERGLNGLGVYHYDQIAAWDRRTVVWVETWFSLRGRVSRERWVEQARALLPETKAHRSVRG